ncbi:CBS domain-containing protein [Bradyrhizobium sp. USDA 3240]
MQRIASLLLRHRISAAPVVGRDSELVGIVTESDFMHRTEAGTERPYSWWLRLLLGDAQMGSDYVKSHAVRIADIMTRKVVTAAPDTPLHEIAMLLEKRDIKRVPIVDEAGQLLGIVSRANRLQAVPSARPKLEISPTDSIIRKKLLGELREQPWAHTFNLTATVQNGVVDLWDMRHPPQSARRSGLPPKQSPVSLL